ncbi:MAG: glycosyltransferase, partial [Thermoplasmata archaeon]
MIAKYLSANCETHVLSTTEAPSDIGRSSHHFIPQKQGSSTGSRIERMYSKLGKNVRASFPDAHAGWVDDAVNTATELVSSEQIKTVMTRSMPASTHLIGLKLKEVHPGIRWIASMSDPISINPYHRYSSKGLESRIAIFEKEIFNKADIVTHSNPWAIEAYHDFYGSLPAKHIVLPNMFDRSPVDKSRRIFSGTGPMIMTYAGRFYGRRTPEPLFKAMRLFLDSGIGHGLKLNIVGAGKSRHLDGLVKKYRLSGNVEQKPFMEPEQLGSLLAASHLLVTIDADFPGDN